MPPGPVRDREGSCFGSCCGSFFLFPRQALLSRWQGRDPETVLILLTNDDGIYSPGLQTLTRALSRLGEVYTVAPDRERSATSHALTLHRPLLVEEILPRHFSVNGTPTDCVNLGVHGILPRVPDLVVAGINKGGNLGDDVTYSGTVAAAMEGCLLGVPAFAISLVAEGNFLFQVAADVGVRIARWILAHGLPRDTLLNVNVPNLPESEIRGVRLTHLGRRIFRRENLKAQRDPRGRTFYWIGANSRSWQHQAGSDFQAVTEGWVSVTPLHLDLTHYETLGSLKPLESLSVQG